MTERTYLAGDAVYHYPLAGDTEPPTGAKVLLLTIGGICVTGLWDNSGFYMAWSPLPKRNREKELQCGFTK